MDKNYLDLKYFLEIANTQNISRAAERLGITQPSLSQSVKKLERDLNARLLIREKRGVYLTKAGIRVSQRARVLLEMWEQIKSDALADHSSIQGRFIIGCHASVARYALTPVLKKLLSEHEKLHFELRHDLSRKITEQVVSRQLDLGIVVNPISHPDLVIRNLGIDSFALWESSEQRVSDTLIADFDLLQVQFLVKELSKKGLVFSRHLSSSSLELTAMLVKNGVGYGFLPSRIVSLEGISSFQKVDSSLPEFKDRICLIYRSDVERTKAFKVLTDAVMHKS